MFTLLRINQGRRAMQIAALAVSAWAWTLPCSSADASFESAEIPETSSRSSPAVVVLIDGRRLGTTAPIRKPANLVEAAGRGDLAAVDAMLDAGADVNAYAEFNPNPWTTALIVAANQGFAQVVGKLLAAGADVNARDGEPRDGIKHGTTALMLASAKGNVRVVNMLLAAKADVNVRDESGQTALIGAADSGRLEVVKALLAAKADASATVKLGGNRSALMLAIRAGFLDVAMALVEGGANVNGFTDNGDSPLRLAVQGRTPRHLTLVNALLARSADIEAGRLPDFDSPVCNTTDDTTATSTGLGAIGQQMAVFRSRLPEPCLDTLVSPNAVGTPLGFAVRNGSLEIVQALLAAKANVNARQLHWRTPLMIAVEAGRADVVRALLAAGPDPSLQDNRGRTAATLAAEQGSTQLQDLLRAPR